MTNRSLPPFRDRREDSCRWRIISAQQRTAVIEKSSGFMKQRAMICGSSSYPVNILNSTRIEHGAHVARDRN